MSVFTTVTLEQLCVWLEHYPTVGVVKELRGIASGITNTNYFVTTDTARFVLTLFEHNSMDELPYFLNLMAHLATHGVACPSPVANLQGQYLSELNGKPASLVSCLQGASLDHPSIGQCSEVGRFLATMHQVGQSYPAVMQNPRGPQWWAATAEKVIPRLTSDEQQLLREELAYQSQFRDLDLPRGVIHADLFRDNVLFDGDRLGGAIDFYYACNDALAYDLAITANDWCVNEDGSLHQPRLQAMLSAYHQQRPLNQNEYDVWPALLRAGALRFWLSRLHDFHFPQSGELTHAKDPRHFQHILLARKRGQ